MVADTANVQDGKMAVVTADKQLYLRVDGYTEGIYEGWMEIGGIGDLTVIKGDKGDKGDDGVNGVTPTIDPTSKHWMIGDYDTNDMMYKFKEPFIQSSILYQKGLRSKSTVIARDAIDAMQDKPDKNDLRYKCAYPIHYADIINEYSKKNNLDAYLVISIIREESYFNNLALSGSNAVGLMQLLPSTAAEVAQRNRYGKINEFLLFNPQTNIKFGTKYFAQIKKHLKDNAMYSVAAYNGGAGSVQKWLNKNEDADEMIENIPYEETQNYVRKIFRSYWNYLRIYKGV